MREFAAQRLSERCCLSATLRTYGTPSTGKYRTNTTNLNSFDNVAPARTQIDSNVAIGVPGWTSGDLTINPTSIAWNHHVDLEGLDGGSIQGPVNATITPDGSWNFTGQLNNSGWFPYNWSVLVVLKTNSGTAFTFGKSGNIGAGVPLSNNNAN